MSLELVGLALAALLAVAAVAFVARPLLSESSRSERPAAPDEERIHLLEERDRALAALKELEFDHRTGKVSDADYRALVGPLRREASAALQALRPREARAKPKVDVHA
jgi:cytochrome c-type biogenesis protein CcmI